MDPENGGGGAANNQQVQPQQEEEVVGGGGGELATPDPAADYLSTGQIKLLCIVSVVMWSFGALVLGAVLATWTSVRSWAMSQSDNQWTAFVVGGLACGVICIGLGCYTAAILALRCCRGSHSAEVA